MESSSSDSILIPQNTGYTTTTTIPCTSTESESTTSNSNSHHHPPIPNRFQFSMRQLMKQASEFQQQQQSIKNRLTNSSSQNHDDVLTVNDNINDTNHHLDISNNSHNHHPLMKQAGSVLQQQIRGIRRRVQLKSSAAVASVPQRNSQSQVEVDEDKRDNSSSNCLIGDDSARSSSSSSNSNNSHCQSKRDDDTNRSSQSERNKRHMNHSKQLSSTIATVKRMVKSTPAVAAIITPPSSKIGNYHKDDDEDEDDCIATLDVAQFTPKTKLLSSHLPHKTIKIALDDHQQQQRNIVVRMQQQPESLVEAIGVWVDSCYHLITGPDMLYFIHSTGCVYYYSTRFCIQIVSLPITIPVQIGISTYQLFYNTILKNTVVTPLLLSFQQQSSGQRSDEEDERKHYDTNIHRNDDHAGGFLGSILSLPGSILDITGKAIISVVAPVLGNINNDTNHPNIANQQRLDQRNKQAYLQQQSTGASSSPEERERAVLYAKTPSKSPSNNNDTDYLDRLRLDYVSPTTTKRKDIECDDFPRRKLFTAGDTKNIDKTIVIQQQSKFLLRINDWDVSRPTDDSDLYYIDIGPIAINDPDNQQLIALSMDRFVQGAISLLHNHPVCRLLSDNPNVSRQHAIQWHPEGSTKRILREMDQTPSMHTDANNTILRDEVLIWSGRFQNDIDDGYGRKHNFFLARGCICMSPQQFVTLLWDNTRTSEYNNFCLGRFTLHGLTVSTPDLVATPNNGNPIVDDDESFLDGSRRTASKVIQSEMRVPFAGITVKAICLMHVRPLPTNDGYIICSRSLDVGPPGIHTTKSVLQQRADGKQSITPAKNEILWGVNIIQSIPNDPNVTQLTSLSQVGSGVPSFLAQKIGLMGIGDFFKNVRQVAALK